MSSDVHTNQIVSRGSLWFGFLGGAVAWFVHIMLAAIIGEAGCVTRMREMEVFGLALPAFLLLTVSAFMLALAAGSTLVAHRNRERLGRASSPGIDPGPAVLASDRDVSEDAEVGTADVEAHGPDGNASAGGPASSRTDLRDSGHHVSRAGVITNVFFVFVIAVQSIPIFYFLTRC